MTNSHKWYYNLEGAQYGPVDESEIIRLIQNTEIPPGTPVCKEDSDDWQPAREHTCFQVEIYPKTKSKKTSQKKSAVKPKKPSQKKSSQKSNASHQQTTSKHDDHHSPEYYKTRFKKLIYAVGTILVVGTIITFAADLVGVFDKFSHAVIFALTVAVIKSAAVVAVFMHIYWDKNIKTITITMICTFIFFIGMMWLTVGSEVDSVKPGQTDNTWKHGKYAPDPEK